MIVVANAFSINMLNESSELTINKLSLEWAKYILQKSDEVKSIVGHAETAKVFSTVLGADIPHNRENYSMSREDGLLVGQYKGPRLPEGATSLPEGAEIQWWLVSIIDQFKSVLATDWVGK